VSGPPGAKACPATDDFLQGRWIEAISACVGLESEPLEITYGDLERKLKTVGPALFRLPDQTFVALLQDGRTLASDLSVRRVKPKEIARLLAEHLEAPLRAEVDGFLEEAEIPRRRRARARTAILRERLSNARLGPCWSLRTQPGANFWLAARNAGVLGRLTLLAGAQTAEYALWILSWWLVGEGALQGRFDTGWLIAWALLLLTLVPLHALTTWLQGVVALTGGGLLKERLLAGALRLDPDEVRREGAGHLLGRAIESEALESLALSGGFLALAAGAELVMAAAVLAAGAGGAFHVLLLLTWIALTVVLAWHYFERRRRWTEGRLRMTHDLVEGMVGHRTRLAQESREHWHEGEDQALEGYLVSSREVDRAGVWLQGLIPRGWMIVGVLGLARAFVSGAGSPAELAVGIGGVLLAWRALKGLTSGLWNLAGAAIAWDQVAPLFHAAARPEVRGSPDLALWTCQGENQALIDAQEIVFRYGGRIEPVLRGCSLRVSAGDRLVLEGASGGGKSTFGAVLAGLRAPESGLLLAGGLDLSAMGLDGWRRVVACAPQFHENHVLSGSFAFNLLMGRPGLLSEKDFQEAAEVCRELGLGELLQRMPAGIMQMVGETGWELSHGERSRLFIARALLQRAEMIVLDEAFAALDPDNLRLALNCISRRAPAALVIAHR
jgi:ATP-binding cassette subfamily B protein